MKDRSTLCWKWLERGRSRPDDLLPGTIRTRPRHSRKTDQRSNPRKPLHSIEKEIREKIDHYQRTPQNHGKRRQHINSSVRASLSCESCLAGVLEFPHSRDAVSYVFGSVFVIATRPATG